MGYQKHAVREVRIVQRGARTIPIVPLMGILLKPTSNSAIWFKKFGGDCVCEMKYQMISDP